MTQRLALVRRQGIDFLVASEAANLSMVERQLGDLDAAEALAREALVTCERIGDRFTPPFIFSGLAAIELERGDHERSATLIGAAESHMEATQMAWPPDERPHYERTVAGLRAAMPAETFARARAAGRRCRRPLPSTWPWSVPPADRATEQPDRSAYPLATAAPTVRVPAIPSWIVQTN
jgi:hypothetical protein